MSEYIFQTNTNDRELGRLQLIEAAMDPSTFRLIQRTGIQRGWSCLELGPGAGSVLKWLGETVGEDGFVMGIDKKTDYLGEFSVPPYDIRKGDFLEAHIETSFDLIHGRYILIHNKNDQDIIRHIFSLLKPGGLAVLEEPDFTSAKMLNDASDISHQRVNSAITKMFVDLGLDPGYGIRLPQKLNSAGFHIVGAHSTMHLCEGNSPFAKLMAESAETLNQQYRATGEATDADIQHYVQNAHDSNYWSLYFSTVSIIAQAPT